MQAHCKYIRETMDDRADKTNHTESADDVQQKRGFGFGTLLALLAIAACLFVVVYAMFFNHIPYTVGSEVSEAVDHIRENGFREYIRYEYSEEFPAGMISGQWPAKKSISAIPIVITESLGPEESLVTVPYMINCDISDAVQILSNAGFSKCRITMKVTDTSDRGIVISQNIPAGKKISVDGTIGITISAGGTDISFTCNGNSFTLPGSDGASSEISLIDGSASHSEAFNPAVYEDPEYIETKFLDFTNYGGRVYDKPLIISGEDNSLALFLGDTTFNSDIILKTDSESVIVYIEGCCKINGRIYIDNNIMQAGENDLLPGFYLENSLPVEVVHGSGICYLPINMPIQFNGETYSYDGTQEFKDYSAYAKIIPMVKILDYDPNIHMVSLRQDKGNSLTEHKVTHIELNQQGP